MLFVLLLTGCNSSHSWAFQFIKYNGVNYIVKEEEVESSILGAKIDEVKYYLDNEQDSKDLSSNYYQAGTDFFEIEGVDISKAIAVKEKDKMIKLESESN